MHKKKVASVLNQGLSLRKSSTDRDKRVKELKRHLGGKSSELLLVTNAFEFGRQEVGERHFEPVHKRLPSSLENNLPTEEEKQK